MIEHDPRCIGELVRRGGIAFSDISIRDSRLLIVLGEAPSISTLFYIRAVWETLGLAGACVVYRGMPFYLE